LSSGLSRYRRRRARWPAAEFSFDAYFAGHCRHLVGERRQRVDSAVDRVGQSAISPLASTVNLRFRSPMATDVTTFHYRGPGFGQVCSHEVHVIRQVFHVPATALHFGLAASLPSVPYFAGYARHF